MQWPGLFFVAYGSYCIAAVASGPEGHLWCFRGRMIHAILGPKGARILFAIIGVFFLVFGALVLFGVLRPAKEREQVRADARAVPAMRLQIELQFLTHVEPSHSQPVSAAL